jgi:hypothetical protein
MVVHRHSYENKTKALVKLTKSEIMFLKIANEDRRVVNYRGKWLRHLTRDITDFRSFLLNTNKVDTEPLKDRRIDGAGVERDLGLIHGKQ